MIKRKTPKLTDGKNDHKPLVLDWDVRKTYDFNEKRGKNIVPVTVERGEKVSIKGERGWFKFHSYTINLSTGAEWVDVFELHNKGTETGQFRSFRPERVTRKHRVIKRRAPRVKKVEA